MTNYRVQKEYKSETEGYTYDILFESQNKEEAEQYRAKLPRDTKRTRYVVRGFKTIIMTAKEQREAYRLNQLIMSNASF